MRVKIVGAGSAGMHHAHAAWELGWSTFFEDTSEAAIERLPHICIERYGRYHADDVGPYDLCIIATPPESHIELALKETCPVLIEKPLCTPSQIEEAEQLLGRKAYVGYCHTLGEYPSEVNSLKVEWREDWGYVLKAHPWLNSVHDSYLGSWERGGGPAWEHSHGLHLWQHFARKGGHGEVVDALGSVNDEAFIVDLVTEDGFSGTVIQDVISDPPVKHVLCNGREFKPMRAFKTQLQHIVSNPSNSPLDIKHGLSTARILASIRPRPSEQPSRGHLVRQRDNSRPQQGVC